MRRGGGGTIVKVIIIILAMAAAVGGTYYFMKSDYDEKLSDKEAEIAELNEIIDLYADTVFVYRLCKDVKSGNDCMASDFERVEIPRALYSSDMITETSQLDRMMYKVNYSAGTIILMDMCTDVDITDSMRYMDVVLDEIPIGLEVGDYIDVRAAFPLGQDFIVISHKKVSQISGFTVKLAVEEKDFYFLESAKTDMALFKPTRLYGAQYVEGGVQNGAETYYPVNLDTLKTMIGDPNMYTGNYEEILTRREELETQLWAAIEAGRIDEPRTVTNGKENIMRTYKQAAQEYQKLQEDKEKAAAREAAKNKGD